MGRAGIGATARQWRPDRTVVVLAVLTMGLTYALIVLGSTVRVTNSGMGCPSWPLCYGQAGPIDQYNALWEQSRRYLVGIVTLAVAATAIAAWTVAVHLVVGFIFFAATTVTAVAAVRAGRGSWSPRAVGPWGWAAVGGTLGLGVAGTVVVGTGAGDDCPSWPLCTHAAPDSMIAWQLVHRGVALVAGVAIIGFVVAHWRATAGWHSWHRGAAILVGVLVAAAALGAATALTRASAGWQDLHLAMAAGLWGLLITLVAMLATRGPVRGSTDL